MRNFQYVLYYNLSSIPIRNMIHGSGLKEAVSGITDLRVKSKFYGTSEEVVDAAHDDFEMKLHHIFKDTAPHGIKTVTVINPMFAANDEMTKAVIDKLMAGVATGPWDKNCACAIFFCEVAPHSEDEEIIPDSWLFKYEIVHVDDPIQIAKNGEQTFYPMTPREGANSAYH